MSFFIFRFEMLPYTVYLIYQPILLEMIEEIIVVLFGPMSNVILLAFFVVIHWALQKLIGRVPDIGSKFLVVYGIHTVLHPITLLCVDCALKVNLIFTIYPTM